MINDAEQWINEHFKPTNDQLEIIRHKNGKNNDLKSYDIDH